MDNQTPNPNNSNVGAYVLIGVGSYFLLKKLGWIPNLLPLIGEWWSVILIVVGVILLIKNLTSKNN